MFLYLICFCRSNVASCIGSQTDVKKMGVMTPNQVLVQSLQARGVGCLCGNIKDVLDACVEDTIHLSKKYKAMARGKDD
jgi:translation elongation factor EF-4